MLPGLMRRQAAPGLGRLDRAAIVEVDVGHDGHVHLPHDLMQGGGAFLRGDGDADDVGAGHLAAADLLDRRLRVLGRRVGHGLDGDRRIAPDQHLAHADLA
jgi:hypothetical protein